MARTNRTAGKAARPGMALILAGLLVPASAFAAVALVGNAEPAPASTPPTAAPTTTTVAPTTSAPEVEDAPVSTVVSVVADPVTATDDDLTQACTVDGPELVTAEADGTITPLQSAALDALRLVCDEEGMPLADPPAPPPVIKTVTVREGGRSSSGGGGSQGTTAPATAEREDDEYEHEEEYEHEDEYEHEEEGEYEAEYVESSDDTSSSAAQAQWESVRADAAAAIAAAVDANPGSELTGEAQSKLAEADRAASRGKWSEAIEQAGEAILLAQRAVAAA